jgi:hypothetical protein
MQVQPLPKIHISSTFQKQTHNALEPIVVDPKQFTEYSAAERDEGNESIIFATSEEKADIITSFILENLIVEAISEDHCIHKFIRVLGPHGRYVEEMKASKYYQALMDTIRENSHMKSLVLSRLNTPLGHSTFQRLMLASPIISEADQGSMSAFAYEPVLDIKLYIMIEERLKDLDYVVRGLDQVEMEKEHIIHKMLFDSINEELDYRRVYGITGRPLEFSQFFKPVAPIREPEMWKHLESSAKQCQKWMLVRAGTLLENEPLLNHQNETEEIDLMREKAMNTFIENYVTEV